MLVMLEVVESDELGERLSGADRLVDEHSEYSPP